MNKKGLYSGKLTILFLSAALLGSCKHLPDNNLTTYESSFSDLPGFEESVELKESLLVFEKSCASFQKLDPSTKMSPTGLARDWQRVCIKLERSKIPDNATSRIFITDNFTPYQVVNFGDESLFTGYYEPVILASRSRYGKFQYPIYKKPPELAFRDKYFTRKDINDGVLNGRGLEIFYAADPVELFFLQIQGSGKLRLDNGETVRIAFDGKNGREYKSIGSELLKRNEIYRPVTAEKIKDWLYNNPESRKEIMEANPSFIFFKQSNAKNGPVGASGLALTPGYSIAIDNSHYSYGTPLWLVTTLPDNSDLARMMVAQDTGSAIKGPVRGDIFFGSNKQAEDFAGQMQSPGMFYILLPNPY